MKKILKITGVIFIIGIIIMVIINGYVKNKYEDKIIELNKISDIKNIDAIVVLGAKVDEDKISLMLKDRLDKAVEVYNIININILNTGTKEEVKAMNNYLIDNNIDINKIKEDTKGLSTFESMKNLKETFKYKKVIIITQKYHLYRSLYIANQLGIDAYGISAKQINYSGQIFREIREILAINKDFILSIM